MIYYRRISERVRKIAPFLTYDQDPYMAIADGRLYWIQDAYTTSNRYPYSGTVASGTNSSFTNGSINYIRNSIKVVIDAYHGTTSFYLVDPTDPIAQTYGRIFPGLLRPLDEMPASLRQRLRYPQDIFAVQASMFATYHMQGPAVFYNKEDQWEVPSIDIGDQPVRMEPYYTIMKLPGEKGAEFIQMLPFTPRQKDNLAAWMIARSDGEHYGKLAVFQFPKQKVVFGPRQVVARINQDQVDRAADHALEPAGLGGHPGHAAGDPDRGVADLHPAAVPARVGRPDSRTEPRHRRAPGSDRDGRDARGRSRPHLPRRRLGAATVEAAGPQTTVDGAGRSAAAATGTATPAGGAGSHG